MTKKWKAWLYMLAAALMICGVSCGDKAYAAEKDASLTYVVESEDGMTYYKEGTNSADGIFLEAEKYYDGVGGYSDTVYFASFAELKELAGKTYDNYTVAYYETDVPLVIEEDLVLPANFSVSVYNASGKLIVPKGITLTLEQYSSLYVANEIDVQGTFIVEEWFGISNLLTVSGVLQNNATISVGPQAVIRFEEGGTYSGTGGLYIQVQDASADLTSKLVGFNFDDFEAEYNGYSWYLRNVADLIKLDAPTDLKWGRDFEWQWNPDTQQGEDVEIERPGMISWKAGELSQNNVVVKIYKDGETEPVSTHNWSFGASNDDEYFSIDGFCMDDLGSGTYYFTITEKGDYTQYRNSETVVSEKWTYVKPEAQLPACSNLTWDWPRLNWDGLADMEDIGYEVEYYYAATADETPFNIGASWWRRPETGDNIDDFRIQKYGNGYYYFRVRALSNDITTICNGVWSELSAPYILTELSSKVENELNNIIDSAATTDEIKDSVQNMDTEELKSAMLADSENTGTVDKIAELENAVGGPAPVAVAEEVPAFDANMVSVIGANLNNAASETEPIELVIDKPEREDVIPEAYDNAVAVRFSMTLENVEDPENLDVPVKITLPVPATINPEFLVILHYHAATSEVEELHPYIYSEGGQYYASFVLTSFSDFVMTQTVPKIEFEDVAAGAYYEEPVQWAVTQGITNGYGSATTFCPDLICTRGQVVTFLWRAKGCPEPVSNVNPFTDIKESDYYYKAVLWAVENGITNGYGSDTTFNPDGECTRGQVATFLWRAEGKPAVNDRTNPFTDVKESEYYFDAVLWAVENGVTNGYGSDTTFAPDLSCSRGQIVTFLYRAMN